MNQIPIQQLATPDLIKYIPEFNGNPLDLLEFLDFADNAVEVIRVAPEAVQPFWLRALKFKITGKAKAILKLYGNNLTWTEIKTYLISHFSDIRDERTLYAQLVLLKQTNNSVDDFYRRILDILGLLNQKVASRNISVETKPNH